MDKYLWEDLQIFLSLSNLLSLRETSRFHATCGWLGPGDIRSFAQPSVLKYWRQSRMARRPNTASVDEDSARTKISNNVWNPLLCMVGHCSIGPFVQECLTDECLARVGLCHWSLDLLCTGLCDVSHGRVGAWHLPSSQARCEKLGSGWTSGCCLRWGTCSLLWLLLRPTPMDSSLAHKWGVCGGASAT